MLNKIKNNPLPYVFIVLIIAIMFILYFTNNKDRRLHSTSNKVNIYVFYGDTCSYSQKLINYLTELKNNNDINYKFNIVYIEVWNDENNAAVLKSVAEYLNTDIDGVPFYIINNEVLQGFSTRAEDAIVEKINDAYNDKNYHDNIKDFLKDYTVIGSYPDE